ncbi:hypothetical protein X560_0746 [Listeria fleischmannii 1991]|uniref:Type II secretion system protein n=2 Tax=Listeria fleischmannii TaxID=1069827 RepID=A0A2X3H9D8_9LIST|nr:hypothetical protein [Listeria fleischmannii]EMG28154.1 late competence protein ComGE [Listeria fleischmannii subsp. fleischmannii LU2006-1]KMT60618.1 hypothetical protein X560_0746 [Listeria fleischmannii 1991]SQC69383.1 Uncharacterised protein [Listeria fleischmannii subsp. fleischmannii]
MKKPNGFTLLESVFSLSLLLLVTVFMAPLILSMLKQLDAERDLTTLYQHLADQVDFHDTLPFKKEINGYFIEQINEEEICGWSRKNKKCITLPK